MTKVTGSFYFKLTVNGNLIGEFTNNHSDGITVEAANRNDVGNSFIGNYQTSWREGNTYSADLSITFRENSNQLKFELLWKGTNIFRGEGFLVDGILIGHYYSE